MFVVDISRINSFGGGSGDCDSACLHCNSSWYEFQTTSCTYLHIEQYRPASYLLQHISSVSSWHLSRLTGFDPAISNS